MKRNIMWIISWLDMIRLLINWPTLTCVILPAPPTELALAWSCTHAHTLAGSENTPSQFQAIFPPLLSKSTFTTVFSYSQKIQCQHFHIVVRTDRTFNKRYVEALKSPNENGKTSNSHCNRCKKCQRHRAAVKAHKYSMAEVKRGHYEVLDLLFFALLNPPADKRTREPMENKSTGRFCYAWGGRGDSGIFVQTLLNL